MKIRTTLLVVIALLTSYWVSSGIYVLLVVPNLGVVSEVPIYWWLVQFMPIILATTLSGYAISTFNWLLFTAFIGAVIFAIGDYIKFKIYFPGHIKNAYFDGDIEGVIKLIIFDFVVLLIMLAIGWLGAKVIRIRRCTG